MEPLLFFVLVVGPVFIGLEWLWARSVGRRVHDPRETLATLGIAVGMRMSRALALPMTLALYEALQPWVLWELPAHVGTFLAALLLMDLLYYGYHRASHTVPLLWALHQTHHSAEHLNLLASARLNWLGPWVIQPVLNLPLVLLGFPRGIVVGVAALDLVFQFFLHTEAIGRLGWLEGWLNTPAAHRVHHARNPACLDRNFGGITVLWDRLLGTWAEAPAESLEYGLTEGHQGYNPVWLVFGGLVRWSRNQGSGR